MILRVLRIIILALLCVTFTACGSEDVGPSLEFVELTEDGGTISIEDSSATDLSIQDGSNTDPGNSTDIVDPPKDTKPLTECELAGIPDTGVCDGDNLIGCVNGEVFTVNCAQLGLFCGPDPDGALSCVPNECEPVCGVKECGGDGCGGFCGQCSDGETCTDEGQCVADCIPECKGKVCGSDGCDGFCGVCEEGELCTDGGLCVSDCQPDCEGKQCGGDGCDGLCGECNDGFICNDGGQCTKDCLPECEGKECGGDTCGGICGLCAFGEVCSPDGLCKPECQPNCEGKECGGDGCGGNCGVCPDDSTCKPNGLCTPVCLPQCQNKQCGPDGCGGSCGTCDDGLICGDNGACKPPPNPCDNCGPDEICEENVCVKDPACGPHTWIGCCTDTATTYCQNGQVVTENCNGASCGWKIDQQYYDCGGQGVDPTGDFPIECPCVPSCEGKQCGNDGCGGSCGSCGPNKVCEENQCVTIPPVDPCAGIPVTGQCEGDVKLTCEAGLLQEEDCAAQDKVCWIDIFPTLQVECKWPWMANCPEFLFDGYCSGNLLIQCEGENLWIEDCTEEEKVCGYSGTWGADCIEND